MKKLSQAGLNLILSFEGYSATPYLDSVKIPTIGYGTTVYPNGRQVRLSDKPCTDTQAMEWAMHHLVSKVENPLNAMNLPVNQNQFDALCSFCYNVGMGAFKQSTLLKVIKGETTSYTIEQCFLMWNKAGSKVLPGLTRRRQAESDLYNS